MWASVSGVLRHELQSNSLWCVLNIPSLSLTHLPLLRPHLGFFLRLPWDLCQALVTTSQILRSMNKDIFPGLDPNPLDFEKAPVSEGLLPQTKLETLPVQPIEQFS